MDVSHTGALIPLANTVLAAGLLVSVATDVRQGKVFDRVTMPCVAAGILLNTLFTGWIGTGVSLAGMATAVGMALLVTLFIGNGLGGGDVKLLAAVGALRGPEFVLWTGLFAALAGPVLCLLPLWRRGLLGCTLRNFGHNAVGRFLFGNSSIEMTAGTRAGKQPFSVAIAAGVVLALLVG
jgi:prepilin peptidase CpaA